MSKRIGVAARPQGVGRPNVGKSSLLVVAIAASLPATAQQVTTLSPYDPVNNSNQQGALIVQGGESRTLSGPQLFASGDSGERQTTIADLKNSGGRLDVSGLQWLTAARLNPGTQNFGVSVPDPITGGRRVASAYNTANLVDLPSFPDSTSVPDIANVGLNQYIDARMATVESSGGTLNIAIGTPGAASTASTNGWTMAAKQTSLVYVDGTGTAPSTGNWTSTNRITFNGAVASPDETQNFNVNYVSHYAGALNVTIGGTAYAFNVNDSASLRAYNDFLIARMQAGDLDPAQYNVYFTLAYSYSTETVAYKLSATAPTGDKISEPIGDRIVLHAVGANASGNIAQGATLEVVNANNGAVRGEQGAHVSIAQGGTLATTHTSGDGSAIVLVSASHGTNDGVINGNFFRDPATGAITDGAFGSNVVDVQGGSDFTNNGILNLATGTTNGAGKSTGIRLGAGATGTNNGIVNVGISGSRSNGSMDGIYLNDPTASFTNAGSIYIGRGPQVDPATPAADVAINQGTLTTGINVANGGTVRNGGNITIGTLTQNAAAIYVTSPVANVDNAGTIDIKGKAAAVPRENDGILVQNGGASGNVVNSGTINVSGVNGVGIKALSTAGTPSAVRTTGIINVAGDADPASGTRNFGVWAEGQGSAIAHADVQGAVNLSGNGAIGIHARGRATVDVAAGAAPSFANGTNQIGFFAFGDNAHINVDSGSILDVSTASSTLFRLDSGADFDGTGLDMKVSGPQAVGVLGSGTGSVLNTRDASIAVSGAGAQGVIAEGGAMATIDAATTMVLTGNGAIAGIADGQKHSLTGANTGSPLRSTSLTSLATLASSQAGVIGYIARNGASLANSGDIDFTGAGTTGFIVETNASASNGAKVDLSGPGATGALLRSGGTFANNGTIHVGNGTGVRVEGAGTQRLNPAGTISVDDGVAGVQLVAGAGLVLGSGDSAIVTRGSAHGVLLDTGAVSLVANGTTITTLGTGNAIENAAEVAAITLTGATLRVGDGAGLRTATAIDPASTATIDVEGAGVGYAFRHADGSPATADLAIGQGFTVNGNAAGSRGIQALTTGAVTSAATVNILDTAGGAALIAGTASSVANTGQLTSASVVAPVVDISNGQGTSFTNTGVVSAASPQALAIQGTGHSVINLAGGSVRGDIVTSGAASALRWTGGTLDGGASLGDGGGNTAYLGAVNTSHTYHLLAEGGSGNVLTFDGTQARGGSFAADDLSKGMRVVGWNIFALSNASTFELTDNLRMAGSEVDIDTMSTLYAGNGVHPVISADADPVVVNNAGTIDLTNGSGSPGNVLTIAGQYVGMDGRLNLATTLNQGGALADQFTDRLLVQGDASGTTTIRITPSAASTGALTDLDRNGYVGPAEGISLVQVAGASTGDAFRIAGGYVAFGPWQYGLYTFAPGASDASQRQVAGSGNGFWDYRLANVLVCDGGPCPQPRVTTPDTPPPVAVAARPAVVPQLPAYIVSPSALALYGYRSIDNLHRRLGEVRQMDDMDTGLGGEPYARVMGGDYAYTSNRSFQDYGFDADIDMRAVQVGTDILDLESDRNSLRAGVAYTHGTTRIDPKVADGYSHAKIDSNSLAMTLTWQHAGGFYLDAIVSGDRHAGDVDTARAKGAARLTGTGWSASLESGYPFVLGQGWELEPQLQVVRQHIGLRDQVDSDGVTTRYRPFDQSIGRAGLRLDRTWRTDDGSAFTPYARLNYIRGWGGAPQVVAGAQGYDLAQGFTGGTFGRMWELGLGGTWQWRDRLSVYGEGDWQGRADSSGARGWSANLGVRWNF